MTLEECKENVGHKVIYTPFKGCDISLLEYGIIKSINEWGTVFVRYGNDFNGKATDPEDLKLDR